MAEEKKNKTWQDVASDWLISIIVAVVLAFAIRTFLVEPYMVSGPSMRPTLQNAERLIVNKLVYYTRDPKKGEIIVFKYPSDTRRDFIKRVIATG
ncbi:MAG: signal peptidase I, partial [Acidaminococcus sp.]|nr:signal peptidase I [Acidaminococcus sp.]